MLKIYIKQELKVRIKKHINSIVITWFVIINENVLILFFVDEFLYSSKYWYLNYKNLM